MSDNADKILCFSLGGYSLGVEQEQVEKILINKHPEKESFVLETGVEVKSLRAYIPLPDREPGAAGNIFFLREQKDFYGFTVDKIIGYLTLKGVERLRARRTQSPIKYFVKSDEKLIPVLDLQYITNNENSVNGEDIAEITSFSYTESRTRAQDAPQAVSEDVDKEEVFQAIEEEIRKRKSTEKWDDTIASEKKGIVLPLVVNIVIVVFVGLGILYYFIASRMKVGEEAVGKKVSGVEEKIIEEVRRRSQAQLEEQKKLLEQARIDLDRLAQEKNVFVQNQDQILALKEKELNEAFQRQLEEAKKRIAAGGGGNADETFAKERERLYKEFLESRDKAREQSDSARRAFERELQTREEGLKQKVTASENRISDVEQRLREEQAKLKEAEQQTSNVAMQQQEYLAFRRQLNAMYNQALGHLSRNNYPQGIEELRKIPPAIASARAARLADEASLKVEDDLAKNLIYLVEREQSRGNLDQIGRKTYEAAVALEGEGKLQEALSRFFTVYTVSGDAELRDRAFGKAEGIMDSLFRARTARENRELEQKASSLLSGALENKKRGELDKARATLEEIVLRYPAQGVTRKVLDELISISDLMALRETDRDKAGLNQKAAELMRSGKSAYDNGYYSEALNRYQEAASKYKGSDYTEQALAEIVRINEELRTLKYKPTFTLKKGEVKTGVVVQILPESSVLVSLGTEDGVKIGDILQVFRKTEGDALFVGSVKIYEANPKTSKGRVVFFEKALKIGDIASY